jgi:hypothetical protein
MVKRTGTIGEVCQAGRALVDAHLRAGDEQQYRLWHAMVAVDCQRVDLEGGDLPASSDPVIDAAANDLDRAVAPAEADQSDR